MIIQAQALLSLLVAVVCSEDVIVSPRRSLSPTTRFGDIIASTPKPHSRTRGSFLLTRNNAIAVTEEPQPSIGRSPASTTDDANITTEKPHSSVGTSSTSIDASPITEEPQQFTGIHSSFFTTDATTSSNIMKLPGNESVSRLLFWPPSAGINVTLNLTVTPLNYTFSVTTALPQHWHSIDIYQPTEGQNNKAMLYIYTEGRYLNLQDSRVLQVQVGSDHLTYWCFCPRAHLCTLISPLRDDDYESGDQTDLLVALLVVVFLLIVTLLALCGVTFYRKSELFHIYARPVDCLPYSQPPPLPKPNKPSARHVNKGVETKQGEADKVAAKTDQTDELGYSLVGGDGGYNATQHSPPAIEPTSDHFSGHQKHESINRYSKVGGDGDYNPAQSNLPAIEPASDRFSKHQKHEGISRNSKVDGDGGCNTVQSSPPASKPASGHQRHESINSLYGLV